MKKFWTWLHRWGGPQYFFHNSGYLAYLFTGLAFVFLVIGCWGGLFLAPEDFRQGDSFRIIYVHVPSAFLAQSSYLSMGFSAIVFLVWKMRLAFLTIKALIPFGMLMTVLALVTGSIWAKPTWGTWWEWDARTVSMLVLLFLYIGLYAVLRTLPLGYRRDRMVAFVCLLGLVNLPIIKFSVDWWVTLHQSDTFTLTQRPKMPFSMYWPLLINILGFYAFSAAFYCRFMRVEILREYRHTQWVQALIANQDQDTSADSLKGLHKSIG